MNAHAVGREIATPGEGRQMTGISMFRNLSLNRPRPEMVPKIFTLQDKNEHVFRNFDNLQFAQIAGEGFLGILVSKLQAVRNRNS